MPCSDVRFRRRASGIPHFLRTTHPDTWLHLLLEHKALRSTQQYRISGNRQSLIMVDVLNYLQDTKNALVGNPMAKVELNQSSEPDGPVLATYVNKVLRWYVLWMIPDCRIVEYLNYTSEAIGEEETAARIRIEAANVLTSLANGLVHFSTNIYYT